jgi:hypothetical protein
MFVHFSKSQKLVLSLQNVEKATDATHRDVEKEIGAPVMIAKPKIAGCRWI